MAFTLRRGAPVPPLHGPASAAAVADADFGVLRYVAGWWYGHHPFLGGEAVRLRICGTLHRPARPALRALRHLRSDAGHILAEIDRRMWEMGLGCLEISAVRVTGSIRMGEAQPSRYELVAVCAGAPPDERALELAFTATRTAPHLVVAWQNGRLADPRPCPSIWQTPPLPHQRLP